MKILVLLFAALLVAGCGEKGETSLSDSKVKKLLKEAVELDFEYRDGLYYQINESEPYSGWAKIMYDSGQAESLVRFKDGKEHGLETGWHENGQKSVEGTYKDGEPDGLHMDWHENGQKQTEATYKDGERLSAKYWNSKGEEVETWKETRGEEPSVTHPLSDTDVERLEKWAIHIDLLVERNDLMCHWSEGEPYSGWVISMRPVKFPYASEQVGSLLQYKDGKEHGLFASWHENGQKEGELTYKDGEMDGPQRSWHENGQKQFEANLKDGKLVGSEKFWNSKGEEVETFAESEK